MSSRTEALYSRLPVFLQELAISLEGWRIKRSRFGEVFQSALGRALAREHYSSAEMQDFQSLRMRELMKSAQFSPFWQERFSAFGVNCDADDIWAEYNKLPILTKSEVRERAADIVNPTFSKRDLLQLHTSGSTGAGLIFWDTPEGDAEKWAIWWRYRMMHGLKLFDECAYFGGRSVVPVNTSSPPYWRNNKPGAQLMFSAYHLSRDTAKYYIDQLQTSDIEWIHGYPSVIALLAGYIKEIRPDFKSKVKLITLGAENLLAHQKALMEEVFDCPVRQHYGMAEFVSNISECTHGSLHVDEDAAYTEFVPLEGQDDACRIIGTGWFNHAFPLIRYDTGDVAHKGGGHCSCGKSSRVVKQIDGRCEDYVVLPTGAKIGRMDHIFKDMVNINEAQIVQSDVNALTLRIVRGEGYKDQDERLLLGEFRSRLGDGIALHLDYNTPPEKTKAGKLRFVISSISSSSI